ncbi:MAG: aminoglycoside phosphotransferase family protein [Alphaproteobacteria bacterium]|nr:aminoglycoside phosphotransferase family protein [Alphaproteobacteria bacterium]
MGLLAPGAALAAEPLAGGVSSDIWRVELETGPACVKRALSKLKVAADWRAPVERNAYEVEWMRVAGAVVPDTVPRLLGHDSDSGCFAMGYLDPGEFPLWKALLRAGKAEPATARAVGGRLVRIHAATAGRPEVARAFATDHIFHSIRLDPYLLATAEKHPALALALRAVVDATAGTRRALVHGDVSPKNILVGPKGPVFLDAECAWYGDPAFDLAFCLNHLLLKCLWTPSARDQFLACFAALAEAYRAGIAWEAPAAMEARTARLLPGLFLARVDGKSPVEYLTAEGDKDRVRRVASTLLRQPVERLADIAAAWKKELSP